jgi:sugar phosphate isomerase/epimerase
MPGITRLSINQATTRPQWSLEQAIRGYAAAGVGGIAVWRDKLAECGTQKAARLLADHNMTVTGLCRGGMFCADSPAGRQAAIDDNLAAIDEAAAIDAQCLVLVVGGLPPGSKDISGARSMVRDGIGALLERARAVNVALAIEPLHPMYAADRSCVITLGEANALCDMLGDGRDAIVGIALDVYHVWWDPNLEAEIQRAGKSRLLAFHICDWLVPTNHMLLDRGMMGDGIIDIAKIRGWVEATGYDGFHEVEIFSARNWWLRNPDEVVRICIERCQTVC